MMQVETRYERKRGCGFRKPGRMYLVSGGLSRECGRLPIQPDVCPTCGTGVKPARGWTWIMVEPLASEHRCTLPADVCGACALGGRIKRAGLLWVGEKFYATPAEFTREAAEMGVSRCISAIPRDFELGETWVLFAHRKCIENPDGSWSAGVFHAFKPTAIEYVVKPDDPEEKLERLVERGITLVRVHPVDGDGYRVGSAPLLETPAEAAV